MADIRQNCHDIRKAVYGREVREALASGIEAINAECEKTTARQDVIDGQEQNRIDNENIRIENEKERQKQENIRIKNENERIANERDRINKFDKSMEKMETTFRNNETARQADHEQNQINMLNDHNQHQSEMQDEYVQNENARQNTFDSREQEREQWYTEFRKWYNEQAIKGRLPVNLDGGYFGEDNSSDNIYDGCNFGD